MYNHIGKKIKNLTKFIVGGGILFSVIGGIVLYIYLYNGRYTQDYAFVGLIVAVVGSLICWLSGFFIYGYGELIDQAQQINTVVSAGNQNAETREKIKKLKEWLEKGLITEEEYRQKMNTL